MSKKKYKYLWKLTQMFFCVFYVIEIEKMEKSKQIFVPIK